MRDGLTEGGREYEEERDGWFNRGNLEWRGDKEERERDRERGIG